MLGKVFNFVVFSVLAFIASFVFFSKPVLAADPTFLVSWKANSYVPANFLGKAFPIKGSTIVASFELIGASNSDRGKIIDLKNNEVRWYINNKFFSKENNLKTISFVTDDENFSETKIKISVEYTDPDTKETIFVNKFISIPLEAPNIVITSQDPIGGLLSGVKKFFNATPFFFSTTPDKLKIQWSVEGKDINYDSVNPWILELMSDNKIPSGSDVHIGATVKDFIKDDILAQKNIIVKTK
ncbi:MAG TPA: hypothetical protein PK367_00175 [Candidatus Paceibacterota bacterium]|nr:hypothetical protein [Candidatus Paceibacterota bacterium]